jgi:hypothetical protein
MLFLKMDVIHRDINLTYYNTLLLEFYMQGTDMCKHTFKKVWVKQLPSRLYNFTSDLEVFLTPINLQIEDQRLPAVDRFYSNCCSN